VAVESIGVRGEWRRTGGALAFGGLRGGRVVGGASSIGVSRCHAGTCGQAGMTGRDGKKGEVLYGMRWRGLLGVMRCVRVLVGG
jgi:hypothetical protein